MKIRHKLILSFLLVASLASVTTLFTLQSYKEINKIFAKSIDGPTRMVEALNGLKQSGLQIVSSTGAYNSFHSEAAKLGESDMAKEEENQMYKSEHRAFETSLRRYEELLGTLDSDGAVTLENIRASGSQLIKTSDEIIELKKRQFSGKDILEKRKEFKADEKVFLKYIDDELEKGSEEMLQEHENVQTSIALATQRTLIVTGLTFILAIFFGLYISFLFSRRIGKLKEAIRKVGSGELDTQIEIDSKDEIGDLSRSFNKMISDLKGSRSELAVGKIFTDKVLDSMVDFVVVADVDLIITQVNKSTLKLNGYEEHEIVGKSVNILMADRPFNKKGVDVLRKKGFAVNFERVIRNKDETLTPVSMSVSVFKDEQGNDLGLVCVGKDNSEHIRAEAEREVISEIIHGVNSTANLDELLQLIHRSIGRVLYAENCFVALHDSATDLMHYEFWVDKFDPMPARRPIGPGLGSYVLRTEKPLLLNDELKNQMYASGAVERRGTKSGSWLGVPLQSPSRTIGVLVVQHYENENAYSQRDLEFLNSVGAKIALTIERKRVEEALRISEEQHRLLFETNPQPAYVYDLETLAFLAVNDAAIRHYGYSREEFLSAISLRDIRPLEDLPELLDRVSRVIPEHDTISAASRHRKKNGMVIDVEITSHVLVFKDRPAEIVFVNDVTERRRLEAESTAISEIIHGVTSTANLDELFQLIHRSIGKILYAENCYVALYDAKTDLLSVPFCIDKYDTPAAPAKLGTGLTAYVLREDQPMLMTTEVIHKLTENGDIAVIGTDPAIWLGVPLRTPEGIIGVLVVQHYENAEAYDQRDVEFLTSVGNQIALVIERKRVEEALRFSEEQHRLLFETNPQPAFVYDLETLTFLAVNEAAVRHYGYSREEFFNAITVKDIHPTEDMPSFLERVSKVTSESDSISALSRHQKKNGIVIDVEITSHALVFKGRPAEIVLVDDITERRRLEAESTAISEIIQGVASTANLDELLQLIHRSIGRILYAENCFVALHDRSTNQLSFEFWADKLDPRPAPGSVGKSFSNYVLRTGKALLLTKEHEREMFASGVVERVGSESASWLGVPLKTPERTVGVLVVQHYDIAGIYSQRDLAFLISVGDQIALAIERKRAEEQLKIFNDKLQQSNRELQDFAYVASHDLQEPLRKVQAFSDRLKTKFSDRLEGEGLDYLERMRSAANRMQLLIQDLLIFSRVSTQAQPFAPVDLNAITQEVLSDLEVKIEETGATVEIKDLPVLDADPMQMRQLIQNLVGNALKFRQIGTAPVITISSQTLNANGNGVGECCQIVVKDNGIGFDQKYTDKIFAVFQRLHGRTEYEGSGVGLAICRKIVERHNGKITANSTLGEGATFAFTIPLKQNDPEVIL